MECFFIGLYLWKLEQGCWLNCFILVLAVVGNLGIGCDVTVWGRISCSITISHDMGKNYRYPIT